MFDTQAPRRAGAVLPAGAAAPTRVDTLANAPARLRRYFARLATEGTLRACYVWRPAKPAVPGTCSIVR